MNPADCLRSRPVGDIRLPVARKFDNFAPMSKFTLDRTFVIYLSFALSVYCLQVDVELGISYCH